MDIEEAKKNLIRAYMEELKERNELMELYLKNINKTLKNVNNKIERYEKLKEEKEKILTELNYLAK